MANTYAVAFTWMLAISGAATPVTIPAAVADAASPPAAGAELASDTTGASDATKAGRVEARSADLLAVGIVHNDRMVIHLSRLVDNAPVRDAVLTVLLRGIVHPTRAEADGSFSLQTKDLGLEGAAAVVFHVAQGAAHEDLEGTLQTGGLPVKEEDKNSARQLGWWVLNFAVCGGFLMLLSRRRKAAAARGE